MVKERARNAHTERMRDDRKDARTASETAWIGRHLDDTRGLNASGARTADNRTRG